MKRFLIAAALAAATLAPPALAADVGVSVSIGQPNFYGRIDIGDYPYPQPRVIYSQPRVIERVVIQREPIYLRVPAGHRKNWSRHCRHYNACGERVFFVQNSWYTNDYAPHYRDHQRNRWDRWDRDHRDGRGNRRDNDHDRGNDQRRGGDHR
jgi:hypothetical protein